MEDKVEATGGFGQEKITLFSLGYILLLYSITCQIENTVAFQNKSKVHLINYIYFCFLKHTSINTFLLLVFFTILQKHTVTVRTVEGTQANRDTADATGNIELKTPYTFPSVLHNFVHITMTGINNSPIIQMNVKHYLTTGLQR